MPPERLLEGLAAPLCRALEMPSERTECSGIFAASIDVEGFGHCEPGSSNDRRPVRVGRWVVRIETRRGGERSAAGERSGAGERDSASRDAATGARSLRVRAQRREVEAGDEPALVVPISSPIGHHAWLGVHAESPIDPECVKALDALGERIGHWLWRYQCAWAWSGRHGQPKALIGGGEAMRGLDRRIVVAARCDLPAHIVGPAGAPIDLVAHAVHDSSARWDKPLIEADVPTLLASSVRLRSMLLRTLHGSLIIRHPSVVAPSDLPGLFRRLQAALPPVLNHASVPRLIMIDECSRAHASLAEAASPFGGALRVDVPALVERRDDFDALLAHLCDRYQIDVSRLTAGARAALLEGMALPGDQFGFERLIARLAMIDPGERIDEDAVRPAMDRHARSARAGICGLAGGAATNSVAIEFKPPSAEASRQYDERIGEDQLAADMLDGKLDPSLHNAIRRAIAWAVANHASDISTPEAAEAACVSSSHLAHLLKAELGTSFRLLLARLRIERARRLLIEKPTRSVTDIALDVGFGDLSHFIKSFNRFTGATPREYRRRGLAFAQWRSEQSPAQG